MKRNKDGTKHAHVMNAQDFRHVPTPAHVLMWETCGYALVKLEGIPGRRFAPLYPDSPLGEAVAALKQLQRFCEERITGTPTK